MALNVCIPDLVAQGVIPEDKAAGISARYERMVAEFEPSMGRSAAEALATDKAIKWMERDAIQKKVDALRQMKAQQRWLADARMKAGDGVLSVEHARQQVARIDKQMDAKRGQYFTTLDGFLSKFRRNVLGQIRNKAELEPIGRVMFGEKVDDLNANELAKALSETIEVARLGRNAVGGHIGRIDNYIPQSHDARAVGSVDYAEWRSFGPIDRVQVRDHETGDWLTGLAREARLRDINETIVSEGANKMAPGASFGGSLANRRSDPRSLHFASYDDWAEYQARFGGGGTLYDVIVGHLSGMARETALMDAMGPNPAATLRFQQDWLKKSILLKGSQKDKDKIVGAQKGLQDLYDELTGANKVPDNRALALGFSVLRAQQVAAKLGSAVLSVGPDFATLLKTAHFNDTPMMGALGRYIKLWNPLDDGDRRLAVRLGLVTDDWLTLTSSAHRYTGEELTGEVSRRLADFVIRGQGLARHTRNGQWAYGMETLSHLTQVRARGFDALDPAMIRQMKRYGINERDWDAYRATPLKMERGSDWIFPTDVADKKAADKVMEMVMSETDYAIIMPDIRTRTTLAIGRSGTWGGELARTALLFKSFPLAIYNLHGRRMLEQAGSDRASYAISLGLMMIAGGAISAQLKTLASGKDPMPMDDPKFLARATAQSGGLGLFGDLLYNSENSFGGGVIGTLAGPVLGQTVPNAFDASFGNLGKATDGDEETETSFAKDATKLALGEVPLANLWWDRLALELTIKRKIRALADPDIADADARLIQRAENEGTALLYTPGEGLGSLRAPNWSNALGQAGDADQGGFAD